MNNQKAAPDLIDFKRSQTWSPQDSKGVVADLKRENGTDEHLTPHARSHSPTRFLIFKCNTLNQF